MGRQKKLPGVADERVTIRVTPEERAELLSAAYARAAAKTLGRVSLADYIRTVALHVARGKGGRP